MNISCHWRRWINRILPVALLAVLLASPAHAELVLSQLVVDLAKPTDARADIEIWNNSSERAYVLADPSEIANPGTVGEQRLAEPDPEKRGLLVSPAKLILEPQQRKLIRLAAIGPRLSRERVYRVTIKPVTGELSPAETGLKLLIGYDLLVLLRPAVTSINVTATRSGNRLTFKNAGNASVELSDGKQCTDKRSCTPIKGKRLYAGAEWTSEPVMPGPVEFTIVSSTERVRKTF